MFAWLLLPIRCWPRRQIFWLLPGRWLQVPDHHGMRARDGRSRLVGLLCLDLVSVVPSPTTSIRLECDLLTRGSSGSSGVSSECATYTWPAINVKAFTCDTASRSNIVTIPGPVTVNPAIVMTAPTGFGIGEGGGPGSATSGVSSTQAESAAPTGPDGGQAQPAIYHGQHDPVPSLLLSAPRGT